MHKSQEAAYISLSGQKLENDIKVFGTKQMDALGMSKAIGATGYAYQVYSSHLLSTKYKDLNATIGADKTNSTLNKVAFGYTIQLY